MTERIEQTDLEKLSEALENDLLAQYGPMLSGDTLRKALGYPSMEAMRQALSRGTIPIPVFPLKNRRGKFALSKDVANWLAKQRISVTDRGERDT
jgi:hypothetical protein